MHPPALTTTVALLLIGCAGCRSAAPMHLWTPPRLESAVGHSVVLATIVGQPSLAAKLGEAIAANRPPELSRSVRLVDQAELQRRSDIQLASAIDNVPSDVALLSAARRQGIDYLLIGQILEKRGVPLRRLDGASIDGEGDGAADQPTADLDVNTSGATSPEADPAPARRPTEPESLTISWRLTDVGRASAIGGMPVTVTAETAESAARHDALVQTAAQETWKLLVPHLRRTQVALAEPYLMPGSSGVRRGNARAQQQRWAEAEQIWREVAERHPWNHAAWHNLALAAAARQDFKQAKSLAQRALRMNPLGRYERTVVWIEGRQRELTKAFGLPTPEEGWLFSPD